MSATHLTDDELVQWLAVHDVIETGHQYSGGELADELDRRFGHGAMERLADRAIRARRDPFDIAAEAFRTPEAAIAAARGTLPGSAGHEDEESRCLPVALAHAATAARRATGGAHPRLSAFTAAVMADELISAGWPARRHRS